jgi:hypothetical protein
MEIKNIIAHGNNGKTNQTVRPCAATMSIKFNEPANKITGKIKRPNETSYEIICAAERKAPKKAYLELLAQPAIIIPYTFKPETANKNKTPYLIFAVVETCKLKLTSCFQGELFTIAFNGNIVSSVISPAGIKLHETILNVKTIIGAIKKIIAFALVGTNNSLNISLAPSAKGCNNPQKPTTLGPLRRWIAAITFRSAIVK